MGEQTWESQVGAAVGGESQRCTRVFPPPCCWEEDIIVCVVVQHCAYHVLLQ